MSYLLDDEIDLPKNAQLSPGAYNYLVDVGCEKSYAKACKMLARRGSIVKPTTVMKAIRKLGEICRNEDICLAESLYCNGGIPESECCEESLNIESDGTYVKMQDGSKIEISALVAYPGKEIQGERTARINPYHFACVGNMNEFWTQGFASIGTRFDLCSIKNIHMGFDGEAKYKNGEKYSPVSAKIDGQLDKFHLNRAIATCTKDNEEARKQVMDCVYEGYPLEASSLLKTYAEIGELPEDLTNRVAKYIENNEKFILANHLSLGTMESSQHHVYKARMASCPCGWSKKGADSIARLRARKASNRKLPHYTREMSFSEKYTTNRQNNVNSYFERMSNVFQKTSGKGYEYPHQLHEENMTPAIKYVIGY